MMTQFLRQLLPQGLSASDEDVALGTPLGPPRLDVKLQEDGRGTVLLSVIPPETGAPPKLDICIVIDVSGSMAESANPDGDEEIKLFSKMDLAVRGAEVIARSLTPSDTLSIISFESRMEKKLPRTTMNAQGLAKAMKALSKLSPGGGTALWAGLSAGLQDIEIEAAQAAADADAGGIARQGVVILLTDGQPTDSPPNGEVSEMKAYLANRDHQLAKLGLGTHSAAKLITMSFGYDANSALLSGLSEAHGGGAGDDYAFIPDGTMLLTNFVNLMANLQSTCARDTVLRITPPAEAADPAGNALQSMDFAFSTSLTTQPAPAAAATLPATDISALIQVAGPACRPFACSGGGTGVEIFLGDVLYGVPRHVVLKEKQPGSAASWPQWRLGVEYKAVAEAAALPTAPAGAAPAARDVLAVTRQAQRAHAVSVLQDVLRVASVDNDASSKAVKECALEMLNAEKSDPSLKGLQPHPILEDLLGQVTEALESKQSWRRWGAHYLRNLISAHRSEACNNFKDPGVLAYSSTHTRRCRDALDAIVEALPVPKPSIGAAMGRPVNVSRAAWSNTFYNATGGCFGPETAVTMHDGSLKQVQHLRKGDLLCVPGSAAPAAVRCVITYGGAKTVTLPGSGLCITPWHPVRLEGRWKFPAEVVDEAAEMHSPQAVYNLVLDSGHIVLVDGIEACTLGHGFTEDVVAHPYFGTQAIVEELSTLAGWEQGWVDLGATTYLRDPETGFVAGLQSAAVAQLASA